MLLHEQKFVYAWSWTTFSGGKTSLRVRKTPPLCPLSLPPLVSVLGATWKRLLRRPLSLSASLCRTAALLWLLSSGFLTKMRHGDRVSAWRKEGSIFSHSACSRSGSKNTSHPWIRECATTHVGHGKPAVDLDFLNSAGSPHDNKSFILSSVVLSGKRKNPNNSAKGQRCLFHYCLMKINPGSVSKQTCCLPAKQNYFKQSNCTEAILKAIWFYVYFCLCLFITSFPLCLHLERCLLSGVMTVGVAMISSFIQLCSSIFSRRASI